MGTAMETVESEREAFESWISASGRAHLLEREKPHGWYKDLTVTAWWTAWEARAVVQRDALVEEARDAARYRWLQTQNSSTWHEFASFSAERAAQIIDAEIEKERLPCR